MAEQKMVYKNAYMGLYDDGTMGMTDGAGFIGCIERDELRLLYAALKQIFEKEEEADENTAKARP
jgi:hypothetical protein